MSADETALGRAGAGSMENVIKMDFHSLFLRADLIVGPGVSSGGTALISGPESVTVDIIGYESAGGRPSESLIDSRSDCVLGTVDDLSAEKTDKDAVFCLSVDAVRIVGTDHHAWNAFHIACACEDPAEIGTAVTVHNETVPALCLHVLKELMGNAHFVSAARKGEQIVSFNIEIVAGNVQLCDRSVF